MTYKYGHLSVPGGGFVTGFVFHPKVKDLLYCRTDIGGAYRYDFKKRTWLSLVDDVTDVEKYKTYPLALALDSVHPNRLYMTVGLSPDHAIGISEDYGKTFTYVPSPVVDKKGHTAWIHGNAPGRSTGERLVVDPYNSEILYLGTMHDGLFITRDRCQTWEKLSLHGEYNITFIEMDPRHKGRLVVGTAGTGNLKNGVRGDSVYISEDAGATFRPLEGQPQAIVAGSQDFPGYVGQRACFIDDYLFVTYAAYNIGWSNEDMVGCDTGKCYDGALFRYRLDSNGQVLEALDLTPDHPFYGPFKDVEAPGRRLGYGLSGLSADPNRSGTLVLSTITSGPDVAYRSTDYGMTFKPIMAGLEIGHIDFKTSYQAPKFNGGGSLIHWMSDFKINPFDGNMALFNTGAGVFVSTNLLEADHDKTVHFETMNEGIEETVHLNVYSLPSGDNHVLDIIGDYGGFIFKDIEEPAENTFADEAGNRWITCMNGDFPDSNPNTIVCTARGNWTGQTKGGLIVTRDQGATWHKLPDPHSINPEIDKAIAYLKTPNVTSGWVAVSSDETSLVWAIGLPLKGNLVIASKDFGKTWVKTDFLDGTGKALLVEEEPIKIFADRVVGGRYFGFGDFKTGPRFFVSDDHGQVFKEISLSGPIPDQKIAGIDSEQDVEIRGVLGEEGTFLFAFNEEGLYELVYDPANERFQVTKLSQEGDTVKRIGLGKAAKDSLHPALYTSGTMGGTYGFYRSDDYGKTWIRINDDTTNFGDIRSISGDWRVYGRIYVATGTRGLVYGEMVES